MQGLERGLWKEGVLKLEFSLHSKSASARSSSWWLFSVDHFLYPVTGTFLSVRKEIGLNLLTKFSPGMCIILILEYTVYISWRKG